jgi:trehalose 6-phosphate phosphatase
MPERSRPLTLDEATAEFNSRPDVVIGVDFDGTLAPLVDHPDLAIPEPRAVSALRIIAGQPGRTLAVVSGRGLEDLRERLGDIEGAVFIGEHGNDVGEESEADLLVSTMATLVQDLARALPGALTEIKTRSVTFHYRNVDEGSARPALETIRAWVERHPEVLVIEGKQVLELTTATRTKGDAILELAGARPIIYLGDDTTDETVFTVLRPGDVGIKVGDGETEAAYRVEDVAGVVAILEKIALASG